MVLTIKSLERVRGDVEVWARRRDVVLGVLGRAVLDVEEGRESRGETARRAAGEVWRMVRGRWSFRERRAGSIDW
jgi:hypothetical protein